MNTYPFPDKDLTAKEFSAIVNKARKAKENKGHWLQGVAIVANRYVEIKAFGTWAQVLRVDDIDYSGPADILVREFNQVLEAPFN